MFRSAFTATALLLALAACSAETTTTTTAETTQATAEAPPPSPATSFPPPADPSQANYGPELANCGGAIAALANIDVANYPVRDGEWENLFGALLALTDKEAPYPNGQTARQAFEEQKQLWAAQPRSAIEARANACRTRFMN